RYKDVAGNESPWVVDSTVYDVTPPNSNISTAGLFNATTWQDSIKGTATDVTSGVSSVQISIYNQTTSQNWNGSSWQFTSGDTFWLASTGTSSWHYRITDATMTDGIYQIKSRATDRAGNQQIVLGTNTFTYDNTPPSGTVAITDNSGYTNDTDPPLTITSSNADSMRLAFGTDTTSWKVYASSDSIPVAAGGDGPVTVYAQFKDIVGNVSGWVSDNTVYDGTDPRSTIATTGTYNKSTWPGAITGTATDSTSGVSLVEVQVERVSPPGYWTGSGWGRAVYLSSGITAGAGYSWSWSLSIPADSLSNGQYYVTCRATDSAGNVQGNPTSASFGYDSSGPAGAQITIVDSSGFTSDATPRLSLNATDVSEMRIGLSASDTISWKAFAVSDSIDISSVGSGNGARVYVQYRDSSDNRSIWISDSTTYDITAPTATISTAGTFNAAAWPGRIEGTASDNASGVVLVEVSIQSQLNSNYWNGTAWVSSATPIWLPATNTASWYYPLTTASLDDGVYSVWARGTDLVGTVSGTPASGAFSYDNTAPLNPEILVTDQDGYTADPDPYLRLTATSADSMRIALSQDPLAAWKPYAAADSIDISGSGDGSRTIYAQFKDAIGNTGAWVGDTTVFDITPPSSVILTPAPGAVMNPGTWTDTINGTASDATSGVQAVSISIRSSVSGRYWNGNAWVDADSLWLAATGTVAWSYAIPGSRFIDTAYTVSARAIDRVGAVQQPVVQNNFAFYQPPAAGFTSPKTALVGSPVPFSDTSKGKVDTWQWDFGDGNSSSDRNPSHAYAASGSYQVRLVAGGPGGRDTAFLSDSILIYDEGQNPMRIRGTCINDTTVELVFEGHAGIDTAFPPPFADSVQLWVLANALPTDQTPGTLLLKYSVSALHAAGDPAIDTVTVPALSPADTAYGFMTSVEWQGDHPSGFQPINGYLVLMRDTTRPSNDLVITGSYLGGDSARLTLDSVSSIDTQTVSRIGVWYGITATADFGDTGAVIWLDAPAVAASMAADTYSTVFSDPLLGGEEKTVYVRALLEGKSLLLSSDTAMTNFTAGNPRPANPVVLHTSALNSETIALSWSAVANVDSIRIWYGTAAVPEDPPGALSLLTLTPGVTDTVDTATGLNAGTRYYFGLQIRKDGLWSLVTQNSSKSDSTPAADTGSIVNSIEITGALFDTATNRIIITWNVDHFDGISRRYGINLDTTTFSLDTPAVWLAVDDTVNVDSITLDEEALVFDAVYCISMWLKRSGGVPSLPTQNSRDTVITPSYTWQRVTYFTKDTVRIFNSTVLLWKDAGYTIPPTTDIVYNYAPETSVLDGFVPAGVGMYFANPQPSQPFFMGFRYDSIPAGYTADDVMIYRMTGTDFVVERGTMRDTAQNLVYVKTNGLYSGDLKIPFFPMVDTTAPSLAFTSETNTVVDIAMQNMISDTFVLRDNILNARWRLYYAKGAESIYKAVPDSSGTLAAFSDTIITMIDGRGTEDNGMRIWLIVDDGSHVDTIDLSRQTIRSISDPVTTEMMTWYPLHTTAMPDSRSVAYVMRSTAEPGAAWAYSRKNARIFRWLPVEANALENEKWIEYSPEYDSLGYFDCLPGRLLWVKTKENVALDFGRATTLSLRDTFTMELPPDEWTDCAVPFRFDMRIGDIIAATGLRGDSLEFYRWEQGGGPDGSIFLTEAVYVPG
ncbi:MAG: PKD domain-containing protein, partial [Chitinivibrionales bacterium]|nr:PKD domain-containing protein [Chitinivibrionales bacterium]